MTEYYSHPDGAIPILSLTKDFLSVGSNVYRVGWDHLCFRGFSWKVSENIFDISLTLHDS